MSDLFADKNIYPMLLHEAKEPFDDKDYIYELKLDGIRCLAYVDIHSVILQNKRHKDVTEIYPELSQMKKCVKKKVVLDGELVCLVDGKPNFYALQTRSLMQDRFKIKLAANKNPIQFCAFDILYFNGQDLTCKPLMDRKVILEKAVDEGNGLNVSRYIEEQGIAFFELAKQQE